MKAWIQTVVVPCVVAGAVLGAGTDARAGTQYQGFPGVTCTAEDPNQASCIVRTPRWGVHNTCSGAVTVVCPLPTSSKSTDLPWLGVEQRLTAHVYDRSNTGDILCRFNQIWVDDIVDDFRIGASSGWGWGQKTIDFGLYGWTSGNIGALGNVLACSIPGVDQGYSHIVGFTVTTPF